MRDFKSSTHLYISTFVKHEHEHSQMWQHLSHQSYVIVKTERVLQSLDNGDNLDQSDSLKKDKALLACHKSITGSWLKLSEN